MTGSCFTWLPLVYVIGSGVLYDVPVCGVVTCPLISGGLDLPDGVGLGAVVGRWGR